MILTKDFVDENKELFFGKAPQLISLVEMNGEDVQVWVRPLSAVTAFEILSNEENKDKNMNFLFISACVVDENGNTIFDVEDVERLNVKVYEKLVTAVFGTNATLDMDNQVEEAEKNSEQAD